MKWQKVIRLNFDISLKEGGRIGGSGGGLEIGELVDSNLSAIRNPANNEFYIPGSSLKGKLRSVLERELERYTKPKDKPNVWEPCGCGEVTCMICTVFGAHKNPQPQCGVTRIIVRDSFLSEESRKVFAEAETAGKPTVEYKTENVINRKSGAADHPRTQERLLPGTVFKAEIILHVYESDDGESMKTLVRHGLGVIQEASSLGAGGSRGSGKVAFLNIREEVIPVETLKV